VLIFIWKKPGAVVKQHEFLLELIDAYSCGAGDVTTAATSILEDARVAADSEEGRVTAQAMEECAQFFVLA